MPFKDRAKYNAWQRKKWNTNPEYRDKHNAIRSKRPYSEKKDNWLRKKYGISLEEYLQLATDQDGVCAICLKPEPVKNRQLAVDHNHETGKVRGLLCSRCNPALGYLEDDPLRAEAAARYLRRTSHA